MNFDIKLYAILDPEHCLGRDLGDMARHTANSGATILQYRAKQKTTRDMVADVLQISEAIKDTKLKLIVNDRVDVALVTNVDGVHLGQNDMKAEDARSLLGPDKIIGLSIKTLDDAKSAPINQIDYAFIGGVFDTQTKVNPPGIGIEGWQARADILKTAKPDMPIGAIAGIDETNVASLFEAGVEGVALISHLFKAEDVGCATQIIRNIIDQTMSQT